jgi:hypothetical protein
MIIRKSQLLIRTIIIRKQEPGGTQQKNFKIWTQSAGRGFRRKTFKQRTQKRGKS